MPAVPFIIAGAAVIGAGAAVASSMNAESAEDNQNEIIRENALKTQVNEIKQVTLDAIGDVNASEWITFYDYTIANPMDVEGANEQSKIAIDAYNKAHETKVSTQDTSSNVSLEGNTLPSLVEALSRSVQQYPATAVPVQQGVDINTLLIIGAVLTALFLMLKKRK